MASSVTIIGDTKFKKKLTVFSANLANSKVALKRVGEMLLDNYQQNFKTEGSTLNSPWKPLSASIQIAKIQSGFGSKGILERTGKLKNSIKMLKLNKYLLEIGSENNYFRYHQSSAARNKLPRRKMIDITFKLQKKTMAILREHFVIPLIKL